MFAFVSFHSEHIFDMFAFCEFSFGSDIIIIVIIIIIIYLFKKLLLQIDKVPFAHAALTRGVMA